MLEDFKLLSSSLYIGKTTPTVFFEKASGDHKANHNFQTLTKGSVNIIQIFLDNEADFYWADLLDPILSIVSANPPSGFASETTEAATLSASESGPWTNTLLIDDILANGQTSPPARSFYMRCIPPADSVSGRKSWRVRLSGVYSSRRFVQLSSSFTVIGFDLSSSVTLRQEDNDLSSTFTI